MALDRRSQKLVIAGASSLLGAELKSVLEESQFAGWDFRLVDEEVVAGTLTEAGGLSLAFIEPCVTSLALAGSPPALQP